MTDKPKNSNQTAYVRTYTKEEIDDAGEVFLNLGIYFVTILGFYIYAYFAHKLNGDTESAFLLFALLGVVGGLICCVVFLEPACLFFSLPKDHHAKKTAQAVPIAPAAPAPSAPVPAAPAAATPATTRALPEILHEELPSLLTFSPEGVYFNDGGTPASYRQLMKHIGENWKRTATIYAAGPRSESMPRPQRMALSAYANAYGIRLKDEHEKNQYLALSKSERARVKVMTTAINDHHKDTPLIPQILKYSPLWWKVGGLAALFFGAFGFLKPLQIVVGILALPFIPETSATVCKWLFFICAAGWAAYRYFNKSQNHVKTAPPANNHAEDNRKRGGVYGSADTAEDYEINEALRGYFGGFAPIFEE